MLRDALLDALALVLPVECAGCGWPDRSLCAACRAALDATPSHHELADGTPVTSALDYAGPVRNAILAFKEQGRTDVARRLAGALARAMAEVDPSLVALAVPTSRAAYRRRGYDPVALLLRRAGRRVAGELRTTRVTAQQKRLGVEQRAANRERSLRARRRLDGQRFLLVDDVMTTGATLAEAARAVRAAGGEVVAAATLAYTPRRLPHPDVRSLNVS